MSTFGFTARGLTLASLLVLAFSSGAQAFCGFYVGRATSDLFNEASKVVYARDGQTSVITMVSDYEGDLNDFAMVVPVPHILEEDQVRLASMSAITHLDDYTAPRLVEYTDPNPCEQPVLRAVTMAAPAGAMMPEMMQDALEKGVTIERSYSVGEYDILILSAEQANGLIDWLNAEGYQIPAKALPVVNDYLDMGMKFFVAKIALDRTAEGESVELNPLQIRFDSPDFMLPIRLGMANAKPGVPQDLIAYFLTRKGQVDLVSYPLARIPSDVDIPVATESVFQRFYQAVFAKANAERPYAAGFLEYAWDMNWCDPCAADPLSRAELLDLGAFWISEPKVFVRAEEEALLEQFDADVRDALRQALIGQRGGFAPQDAREAFVTRIHMRYQAETHPHDLILKTTGIQENFQGRYVMRHAATLTDEQKTQACGEAYLAKRKDYEASALASFADVTGFASPSSLQQDQ